MVELEPAAAALDSDEGAAEREITALILCPSRVYCDALEIALGCRGRFSVLGSATTSAAAISAAVAKAPDLIFVQLPLPEGPIAARELLLVDPRFRIVALSNTSDEAEVVAWAEAGASACVGNDDSLAESVAIALRTLRGEIVCSPRLASALFNRVRRGSPESDSAEAERLRSLTRREREILELIAQGLSNKQIAKLLQVQVATVKNHVHGIFAKLSVHSRAEAAALASSHNTGEGRS